jgi:hypothetical protein
MVLSRYFEPPDVVTATLGGVVTAEDQIELVRFGRTAIATEGAARRWLEPSRVAARAAS